jgi:hypothetical protein
MARPWRTFAPPELASLLRNQTHCANLATWPCWFGDGNEAKKIRQALAQRGVRSVYLSDRDSVYATREALDLACIWKLFCKRAMPSCYAPL